jgi:hypothetical protein
MSLDSVLARVNQIQGMVAPVQPAAQAAPATPADAAAPFADQLQSAMGASKGSVRAAPADALGKVAAPGSYPHLSGDLDANPEILQRLEALAARRGESFDVTSGLRTIEEQQRLWDNRGNNPYPVARPGTSRHQTGRATDVTIGGRAIQDVIPAAELRAAGLVPLAGDAVHVELP